MTDKIPAKIIKTTIAAQGAVPSMDASEFIEGQKTGDKPVETVQKPLPCILCGKLKSEHLPFRLTTKQAEDMGMTKFPGCALSLELFIDQVPPPEICGRCSKPKKTENEKDRCHCGRPMIYSVRMVERTREYLEECEDIEDEFHKTRGEKSDGYERLIKAKLPTIEGLAVYLKISVKTIYEWEKEYEEFCEVINELRAKQADRLINKGISGDYNPMISKVLLTKHGYRDSTELTGKDGKDLVPVDPKAMAQADKAIDEFLNGGREAAPQANEPAPENNASTQA